MILQICLIVLLIGLIFYYMMDRYIKVLDIIMMITHDFYFRIESEFNRRKELATKFIEDARELIDSSGDLIDKKDEELFENIMREANELLDMDLIMFSKAFNKDIEKVKSELLWDWWHINKFNINKYLDKKYINFITGK